MAREIWTGLAAFVLASPAIGSDQATALVAFADAFDRAQLAQDRRSLERMTADDLVFIDGTGKRSSKTAFVEGWTDPGVRYDPITLIDRVVVPIGPDAGIVSAEVVLSGVAAGKPFSSRLRFSDTFRRMNGQWRAIHIQVTRIAGKPTP